MFETVSFFAKMIVIYRLSLKGGMDNQIKARLVQAQKEVSCISQGYLDIASYFSAARRVWDEFDVVEANPGCSYNKCECKINPKL